MPNYRVAARRAARRYGLDPGVFVRQIQAESGFNPHAVSPAGARGIAQIMPKTAAGWGVNPDNPREALDAAARNMASYARKYGGIENALRAYNAGPGAIKASHGYGETNAYVAKILRGSNPKAGGKGGTTTTTSTPGRLSIGGPGSAVNIAAALAQRSEKTSVPRLSAPSLPELLTPQGYTPVDVSPLPKAETADAQPTNLQDAVPEISYTPGSRTTTSSGGGGGGALPSGVASFEGKKVAAWIKPALVYARKQGWKGSVSSGFRSRADQTRIYNSGVRPAARPGTSNHEGSEFPRGAIDVSDAQQLARVLRGTKYGRRLKYAGAKDPVHFSHPHGGSY